LQLHRSLRSYDSFAVNAGDRIRERLKMEVGKRLIAAADIEKAVQQVRTRTGPRHRSDFCARHKLIGDKLRNIAERGRNPGDGVQGAGAAVPQDPYGEMRNILNRDVIALFFAVAEYCYGLALSGLAPEPVWPVA
jgi:hypothetical protein